MDVTDKSIREKTQFEIECDRERDEESYYFASFENEKRRKLGKKALKFYLNDLRTPEEIKANKEFREKCLQEALEKTERIMLLRYMHKVNKEIKNDRKESNKDKTQS